MAHPLITIESRGSNKRDVDDINLNSLLTNPPISEARTSAVNVSTHYHHTTTTTENTYQHENDIRRNNSLTVDSQQMSSSSSNDTADLPTWRLVNILLVVGGMSFLTSFSTGVLTIGIPRTAVDIGLSEDLILW